MKCSILTLNLRFDNPEDGPNRWSARRDKVVAYLRRQNPDLIAFQEVLPRQRDDLDRDLPGYRSYGLGRDAGNGGEQCSWFVRDPWYFEEAATFWLSETPDRPSRGWDAQLPRTCSWIRVRSPQGALVAANVHLDHVGAQARRLGLELVARRLAGVSIPALLVGDFNQPDLSRSVTALESWTDCQVQADQAQRGTFHGFQGGTSGPRIDAILASPHWCLTRFDLDLDPALSDHYPLRALLEATPA